MSQSGFDEGFDGGRGPSIPSYRSMFQPTSVPVAGITSNSGDFLDKKAKVNFGQKMKVVVLAAKFSRRLMPPFGSPDKEPYCKSSDGKRPDASIKEPKSETCDTCQYKTKDIQYLLICLDVNKTLETGNPVVFGFYTNVSQSYNIKDWYRTIPGGKNPRDFVFTMEGERSKRGAFNELKLSDRTMVSDDLAPYVEEAASIYVGIEAPEREVEEVVEDAEF